MHTCRTAAPADVQTSAVDLMATWCHHCMAWSLSIYVTDKAGRDVDSEDYYRNVDFGPFDTVEQVCALAKAMVTAAFLTPGRPWDLSNELQATDPAPLELGDFDPPA